MNSEEREQLVEIVKQSNEVILGEVPFHDTDSTIVTPELNLNEIVVAHVKSQCPECGKYLANVNEHMKLVHLKIRYVFSVTFQYSNYSRMKLISGIIHVHRVITELALKMIWINT